MKVMETVPEMVRYVEKNYSHSNHLNYQSDKGWDELSTQEFVAEIKWIALGLRSLGIKKGDMIGILADSSPRWTITDLAIMCAGAVSVPLFSNISVENFIYEVNLTQLKQVFVSGKNQWNMFKEVDSFTGGIDLYDENLDNPKVLGYSELLEKGQALELTDPSLYHRMLDEIQPNDMATIIFTSGTTGAPKGALFYHKNICGQVNEDRFDLNSEKDSYLSILPLAHIFSRGVNMIMIAWGVPTYYLRDMTTLGEVCKTLKPTLAIVVPRIIEKIYAKMYDKIHNAGFFKRTIGQWAFSLASSEEEGFYKTVTHPLVESMVYSKLREALGGRFRVIACGGAKLSPHLHHFFVGIGIPLYEGWGLTEAGLVCIEPVDGIKFNSVGLPLKRFEVKISDENEILVKGPTVMQGYYKNEEATKDAFTNDGWLRTGDKGHLDSDGYLIIDGRLKEIYKSSTGEWVVPVPIEQELSKAPLIETAMVVGEDKKFVSCLLFPDFEVVKKLKKSNHMDEMSDEEFLKSPFIHEKMNELLKELNSKLNSWEQIQAYCFIPVVLSIEGGELTPTLKVRRNIILKKYQEQVDAMYSKWVEV